jgi:uroporphyrin-III C-methyltransferase/precorrin-2 dehydrogenase/sirohydrochlorin ferrochelatase
MSGYLQTLSFPIVADFLGTVLHRVTDAGRALLRKQPAENNPAAAKAMRFGGNGSVSLVGAGPGDPELLTLKALRALRAADVLLHDQLVSADVLALAPPHVERIDVGKKGYGRACRQGDINDLMVALANAGRRVVRLKAGDPLMFGRLEEEIGALEAAGIAFDVIPGISAAQGAAARLGVPLTRRRGARRFQAITGHASDGHLPGDFDWSGVADPKATTAVYMPKATLGLLCAELMRRGLPAEHPAVAVFNATRANESIIAASIGTLPAGLASVDTGAPCIILIGVAASRRAAAIRASAPEPATACV